MEDSPKQRLSLSRILGLLLSENSQFQTRDTSSSTSPYRQLNKHKSDLPRSAPDNYDVSKSSDSSRNNSSLKSPSKVLNIRESLGQRVMEENKNRPEGVNNVEKKTVKLDLLDNNQGFSISTSISPVTEVSNSRKLNRSHWKHPSTTSTCTYPKCDKSLGLKNGTVNCRKCGELFCYEHTDYKILLKNSVRGPIYDCSDEGIWSKCCKTCYMNKPDRNRRAALEPLSIDLMNDFKRKRSVYVDNKLLLRDLIQKKFIKLVNILVQQYYKKGSNGTFLSFLLNMTNDIEKGVAGLGNWENDSDIQNCSICFVHFNFFIRKHHCRLCGKIVCEDSFKERKECSLIVPIAKFLSRVPNLNYSPQVKQNFQTLLSNETITFRCCANCRDDILYDWKHENINQGPKENLKMFAIYDSLITLKRQIAIILPKYEEVLGGEDLETINKFRNKLMRSLKEFENLLNSFRENFFVKKEEIIEVNKSYESYKKIIMNIYQGSILFLQENLSLYKRLTTDFKEREQEKLKMASDTTTKPDLTKKQIRELREELMVVNEQKFLIENLIENYTKMRKFDELNSLKENKKELAMKIDELESKLGEFGF